jgi:aldehyde dehydrogenase (NAD+)
MKRETMSERALNHVAGRWEWPEGARAIESRNPADWRQVVATAPDSPASAVGAAVAAARAALPAWRRTPPPRRGDLIRRAADILTREKERLARLVSTEMGKPLAEGRGDVQEAIDMAHLAAGEGRRLYGETVPSELPDKLALTFREPVGVCGLITPWNFPTAIPAWKGFHALICGNTFVLKPAEDVPLCAAEFVRCLEEAGFPPGVVNLVQGRGEVAGAALVDHAGVDLISFTGSSEVGALVGAACARRHANVSLEMGGKNAQIVLADADLDLALDGVLWGAFGTAGQRCTATSRLIVDRRVHDEFVGRLHDRASRLRLGPGTDAATEVCPLINEQQFTRVMGYIDIGGREGARVALGGRDARRDGREHGWFVEPTIFTGVSPSMRIFREEIFGPVLSVVAVDSAEEAVRLLNESAYGLSSSIYTRDINAALRATRAIEAGIVYVNGPTIGAEVQLPFGGVKKTGNGHREAGRTGLDIFTEWKTVYVDYSGRLQRAQIDVESV